MADQHNHSGNDEWDSLLQHLRQVRQQVLQQGPLPEHEKADVTDAFRRGLALLEDQMHDLRGTLKGTPASGSAASGRGSGKVKFGHSRNIVW